MAFKSVKEIGKGGFGVVELVQDSDGNSFARKTFEINQGPHLSKELEDNIKKRFNREVGYQSAINHKNIVPIVFSDLDADPPYYIMPLAVSTLQADIQSDKTLGGKYMNAMIDIIAGLEELHNMAIYHRDLKPANVLRFESKEDGDIREYYAIGDFGLISLDKTAVSTLTSTGMRMGSDFYTAPEIVKELKYASPQSDIYSLGCILHEMVGTEPRVPCAEIREKGDFAGILLNCTRIDPSRRFKSVIALRDALLSLGDVNIAPSSREGAAIFGIIENSPSDITENEWKIIVSFVEDEYESEDAVAILRKLTIDHLEVIINSYPLLAKDLGLIYAKWIRENSFNFEECDGLSIRLAKFINGCPIDVKAECLMSMLFLGTSHNRFYVERKFASYVDKSMDVSLAKRLAVEMRVNDRETCGALKHLASSINFKVANLHPILLDVYRNICK